MVLAQRAELEQLVAGLLKERGSDKLDFRPQTEKEGAESFSFLCKIGSWFLLCVLLPGK